MSSRIRNSHGRRGAGWRSLAVAAAAAVATSVSAVGPVDAADATALSVRTEGFTLDNGLRVVLAPRSGSPTVAVAVYYDVGSASEVQGRSGFAHLFEHMMFQGSANVPKGGHFQHIFGNGGNMNGTTSEDRTNYFEILPSDRLGLALWLESDRMKSLAVTQENFENQREVVKEERRTSIDNQPYNPAWLEFDDLAYECWPYTHSTIGSMDDLNAAQLADVQAFFDLYYKPNNAVLVIAGDFDESEARAQVEHWFGSIARGAEPPRWQCDEPEQTAAREKVVEDALAKQPAVMIGWKIEPEPSAENDAAQVLSHILGGGESSRLYGRLVRETGHALDVESFTYGRRGPDLLGVFATSNGVASAQLRAELEAEVAALTERPITAEEVEAAKQQLMRQVVSGIDGNLRLALRVGEDTLYHGEPDRVNGALDRIRAVTVADVQRLAQQKLRPERATVVRVDVKARTEEAGR